MASWTAAVLVVLGLTTVNGQFFGGAGGAGGGGTCTFDLKCYMPKPGCSLIKETPFWRMTPISCEDCLALCQEKLAKPVGPFCCRSVVYDAVTRTCDIFAVASRGSANTGKYEGRIYFQPTGAPGCAGNNTAQNATGAPSASSICKEGETAKLIVVKDVAATGLTGKDAPGLDADACGKACMDGKLPDGTAIACKAAQFTDGKCTLSEEAPKSEADQTPTPGSTLYRVFCFPSDLIKNCPDPFMLAPQKILVGQNKLTVDKPSLDECIAACLTSEKDNGFVCKSAIFYYNEQKLNCILNVESSKTKPDLFTDAGPEDIEVYFEADCSAGRRLHDTPKKRAKAFKDALNDIPEHGAWSLWSPCHGRQSKQVRFQRCRKLDSRDCEKEYRSCDPKAAAAQANQGPPKKTGEGKLIDAKKARDQVALASSKNSHPAPRKSHHN